MWWILLTAFADPTPWTSCNGTVRPLTASDVPDPPDRGSGSASLQASLADVTIPVTHVRVAEDGTLSGTLPRGPVRLSVHPDLQGQALVRLYRQLDDAGAEPVLVLPTGRLPADTLHPTDWTGWPVPARVRGKAGPVDGWESALGRCKAGKALLASSCDAREAAWKAVLDEPKCGVETAPDRPLLTRADDLLVVVPFTVDPEAQPQVLFGAVHSWGRLRSAPPAWVRLDDAATTEPVAVEASSLDIKSRKALVHPAGADPSAAQTCRVEIRLDAKGIPTQVDAVDCPEAYRDVTVSTLMQWRWYPPRVDAERVPVVFRSQVVFPAR